MITELEQAPGPAGQLAAMAAYDRRLFERAGDVIALLRDAGRGEPELARVYRDGRRHADRRGCSGGGAESWPGNCSRPRPDERTRRPYRRGGGGRIRTEYSVPADESAGRSRLRERTPIGVTPGAEESPDSTEQGGC